MKRILVDVADKDWYLVFLNLIPYIKNRAYKLVEIEDEETHADVIILNSFDELIAFNELFGYQNCRGKNYIFIIRTQAGKTEKNSQKFFEVVSGEFFICDADWISELVESMLLPHELSRDVLLAEKPIVVSSSLVSLETKFDEIKVIFDDD